MYFVEVAVAGAAYHGDAALTYSSEQPLSQGSIVIVPLRRTLVLGIVLKHVSKPSFAAKPISSIADVPVLPPVLLGLMTWMKQYYPSSMGIITQQFLPKSLPKKAVPIAPIAETSPVHMPPLTNDQKKALDTITSAGTYLLHGETGTGKTRVYIELTQKSIAQERSVIILTPEIGLTSQLAHDFKKIFGDRVIVIHSQLTEVTRQRLWTRILKEQTPLIIIGPRSALFSPLKDIGLIVIDESHESAYKQDQSPFYHATRVANALAALHKAPIILGSATPLVSDYFLAQAKNRPIIRMTETASRSTLEKTEVTIVDLKDRSQFTKKAHISNLLIDAIKEALSKQEQVLLFLNRRGTARVVFCENCGWQSACPNCDVPLVYHGDNHKMRCHSCGYSASVPISCPECQNASIIFKSIGTKAIVDEITNLFPSARVMRFDTDNKKAERIEQHYTAIKEGAVDILIGTQTLAKGIDLPRLGLVGVIIADTSLYFPDFSAEERTYQLLSQVLGRVGRGHRKGKVILQTYDPESPLLKAILAKDWSSFYNSQIKQREQFLFPPFCYLLKLTCRRASSRSAQTAAEKLAVKLRSSGLRLAVEGPAPAFHEKVQNKYQWQLIVKSRNRKELLKTIELLPSGWSSDIDPNNLL